MTGPLATPRSDIVIKKGSHWDFPYNKELDYLVVTLNRRVNPFDHKDTEKDRR